MNYLQQPKFETLIETLLKNADSVRFGEVILSLKIHDSRIVSVTHTVTNNTIHKG